MGKLQIGAPLRYARPYNAEPNELDGLPNYFSLTHSPGLPMALLEAGINPIGSTPRSRRIPAILVASSPHKAGTEATPWQDFFHPDAGHIRYFGDNKLPGADPAESKGNLALLQQFDIEQSRDRAERLKAAPILFFKRTRVGPRSKGNVVFQGYGIIERVERVVQHDPSRGCTFTNYAFDFAVFSLIDEGEEFDWSWITSRRNNAIDDEEALKRSPQAWRDWVNQGTAAISRCRRRVSKMLVVPRVLQRPISDSKEDKALRTIYRYYDGKKHHFEVLAEFVAARILRTAGSYRTGWITPKASDGGADFVGRLDIGSELARVKLVVLGQAKCESPTQATGGNHIARTVARLRRGWIGVYVTTSYFSESVQREVIEDKYPIILVDGLRLATEVLTATFEQGIGDVKKLLSLIEEGGARLAVQRNAEEILLE